MVVSFIIDRAYSIPREVYLNNTKSVAFEMNPKFQNLTFLKTSKAADKSLVNSHQSEKIEEFIMNNEGNQLPFCINCYNK